MLKWESKKTSECKHSMVIFFLLHLKALHMVKIKFLKFSLLLKKSGQGLENVKELVWLISCTILQLSVNKDHKMGGPRSPIAACLILPTIHHFRSLKAEWTAPLHLGVSWTPRTIQYVRRSQAGLTSPVQLKLAWAPYTLLLFLTITIVTLFTCPFFFLTNFTREF